MTENKKLKQRVRAGDEFHDKKGILLGCLHIRAKGWPRSRCLTSEALR